MSLKVLSVGPGVSVQDCGRSGWLNRGLSRGGAMDLTALREGAALLTHKPDAAALEMAGMGGRFAVERDMMIALTGAEMRADLDGAPLLCNASHGLREGQILTIGPALMGIYGYLHLSGGVDAPQVMGAASAHLTAGIGRALQVGDQLRPRLETYGPSQKLRVEDRLSGGVLRIVPSAQTELFDASMRARLAETVFHRDPRSNRMAVRLRHEGPGFAADGGLSVLSEITQPGDIQVTGDGTPVILMAEAQTTGGYPRIASILPCDLARAAQCPPGMPLQFSWIDRAAGLAAERAAAQVKLHPEPVLRDPHDMADLLSYSLIDGVTNGDSGDRS